MPGQSVETFATETMTYIVAGNSIDVTGEHAFSCTTPQTIDRYYGMQSMFIGETEVLTPGGKYSTWTPIASVDRFTHMSAPNFNTFIEHSANGYQQPGWSLRLAFSATGCSYPTTTWYS